ncbi:type 1 glutamine amidotransferase [Sediminicola sp. 1XM1-17]|uniref:type 1 glutamine amidotransferase n=1 Tax=Sediminicola sp. 1XM1-17 TaxID=3127702 RepID=UPI003077C8A0
MSNFALLKKNDLMKMSYNIAVLDMNAGRVNEGMRCIKKLVEQFLSQDDVVGQYTVFEVRNSNEIPDTADYDIFISSGGPGAPFIANENWEEPYFAFLDSILNHNKDHQNKKHLFLICHSFQLACLHWDLAKVNKRKSTSFGVMPVHKTKAGLTEPLFEGLMNPFFAVDSRDYQVVKPKDRKMEQFGAEILCKEKIRPHIPLERAVMGIRFSKEIFGVQFHPEADSEGMLKYFNRDDKRALVIKHHGKKKYLNMLEHLEDEDKIVRTHNTMIPGFLNQAALSIKESKLLPI